LGKLQQFSHRFDDALASLAKAHALEPASAAPLAWRAAIFMVQARYPEALAECARLAPLAEPLLGQGCKAYAQGSSGQLEAAFNDLSRAVHVALQPAPGVAPPSPELLLWQYTRLAEMAQRLGQQVVAEKYFQKALALQVTDQFLLGAYADFLLSVGRPAEVLTLLAEWERSDILLLRLALAGQAAKDGRFDAWRRDLRDRFAAAASRGDRLHELEAARFALDIDNKPAEALALAADNYAHQKEPRDAAMLMRAALAASKPQAAQPALDWLRAARFEDPDLTALAGKLAALGAQR
jgi:hypothetical protein